MRRLAGVLLALLATGCAGGSQQMASSGRAAPEVIDEYHTLSAAETKAVHEAVRSSLKDPESARFGRALAGKLKGDVLVCGMVNAKNSYGGYTGEKPYFGLLFEGKRFGVAKIAGDDISVQAVQQTCAEKGLPI
jgi:hypothetical protein